MKEESHFQFIRPSFDPRRQRDIDAMTERTYATRIANNPKVRAVQEKLNHWHRRNDSGVIDFDQERRARA